MPYLKQGNNFLYDSTTNDIIGIKDPDSGERYFNTSSFQVAKYGSMTQIAITVPAATFTTPYTLASVTNKLRLTGGGAHGLTAAVALASPIKSVRVTWDGTGDGVNGLYQIAALDTDTTGTQITLELEYRTNTVTITIAAPAVLTATAHGFTTGQAIRLTTTGALPTGLATGTTYYVRDVTANTFSLATTVNGTAITTTGTQSGTHTATRYFGVPTVTLASGSPVAFNLTSVVIPANTINTGMHLELNMLFSLTGSTNTKIAAANIGTGAWYSQTVSTNNQSLCVQKLACAVSSSELLSNALAAPGHGLSTLGNVRPTPSGGFTTDQTLTILGTVGTANEFLVLESWNLVIK